MIDFVRVMYVARFPILVALSVTMIACQAQVAAMLVFDLGLYIV